MKDLFGATVQGGRVVFDDANRWRGVLARHEGKRVTVALSRERQQRSLAANRWYWSVVVPIFGEWSGYEKDEAHGVLKSLFLMEDKVLPTGKLIRVPGSTARLSTQEFSAYCERVMRFLAENGVYVPSPGESVEASL